MSCGLTATSPASNRTGSPRLLAPMLDDESVALVKAVSHRPTQMGGGGRTTELVTRPLLSLYYPELTGLHQPLAGEYAGRRVVLEQLPFVQGWGVEIAMLIDLARQHGPSSIAQIDVGTREHRHRSLHALSVQAAEVMATMLARVPDGSLLIARRPIAVPRRRFGRPAESFRTPTPRMAHAIAEGFVQARVSCRKPGTKPSTEP